MMSPADMVKQRIIAQLDPKETTALTPAEEHAFLAWTRANKISDVDHPASRYDYRGFWKATKGAPHVQGEHFPDTFKQHGHPTFSDESQYAVPYDLEGGIWVNRGGGEERIQRLPVVPLLQQLKPSR